MGQQCSTACLRPEVTTREELSVPSPNSANRFLGRLSTDGKAGFDEEAPLHERSSLKGPGSCEGLPRRPISSATISTVAAEVDTSPSTGALAALAALASAGAGAAGAPGGEEEENASAAGLLRRLRALEAARRLDARAAEGAPEAEDEEGIAAVLLEQIESLARALEELEVHPGMQELATRLASPAKSVPTAAGARETLLGVPVPIRPLTAEEARAADGAAAAGKAGEKKKEKQAKRDSLEFPVDLDANHKVIVHLEFCPDGTVSIQWMVENLPIPLPLLVCLVQEVDLAPELAPYMVKAEVLKEFPTNEADRLVRLVSKPPIPFVAGIEATPQRTCFDLLDTPWGGLCLTECQPVWTPPPGGGKGARPEWRGFPQPKPYNSHHKQIDVDSAVSLARPVGQNGELTSLVFCGKVDLKISRSLIPNWLITWLCGIVSRHIWARALAKIAAFQSSSHGERMASGPSAQLYAALGRRCAEFVEAQRAAAAATAAVDSTASSVAEGAAGPSEKVWEQNESGAA